MGGRVEADSPLMQTCHGWGLNLTVRGRQRMLRRRLLQVATPFLALGGLYLSRAVAARSLSLLAAIPWLAPRWLAWPGDIQQTQLPVALAPVSPFSGEPRIPAPSPAPAEAVAYLAQTSKETASMGMGNAFPQLALSLALRGAYAGVGMSGRVRSNSPAHASPFSGEPRISAPSLPAPAGAFAHPAQAGRETANMGMGSAFPQPHIKPQLSLPHSSAARQTDDLSVPATDRRTEPGAGVKDGPPLVSVRSYGSMPLRLAKMAPLGGPPGFFMGLAPGSFPVAYNRIMACVAPGHRAKYTDLLSRSLPEAVDTPAMPPLLPLPEHKLHGGRETVAPGLMHLPGLSLVLETIRHTMKREVAAAIRQREEEHQSLASNRTSGFDTTTAENLVSDNLVRLFMQKMRKLAEEERFRLGLLR
ncbi:hypothetical protein [Pelotomaculum sp. PtaB.Bin117]|uniref:hypothetical protein n=1 Tax=Pelotomaculum sp. PtaB.Bin117 TaxID=1811694 RepID=UPI00257E06FD|nr:hypothetical protein [Pelotomaculum sp. PtaB.Bin117]